MRDPIVSNTVRRSRSILSLLSLPTEIRSRKSSSIRAIRNDEEETGRRKGRREGGVKKKKKKKKEEKKEEASSWAMEKRDTKTGMRSNEVNARKLRQPRHRVSVEFWRGVYRVSSTHVQRLEIQASTGKVKD